MQKIFLTFEFFSTTVQKISFGALKKTIDLEFVVIRIRLFLHRPNETFHTIPENPSSEQKSPLGVFREYWRFKSRCQGASLLHVIGRFSSFNCMN